jgi:hypothetical protein
MEPPRFQASRKAETEGEEAIFVRSGARERVFIRYLSQSTDNSIRKAHILHPLMG